MAFVEQNATGENPCPHDRVNCRVAGAQPGEGSRGSGNPPLAPRTPPLLFLTVIVGVVASTPRRINQQQHGDDAPAQTPSDYYRRAVAIPLLDHLQSEMKHTSILLMMLSCPASLIFFLNWQPSETEILTLKQRYQNDLPSPHEVDVELLLWKRKWCSTEDADLPTFILCTLPITSAECERSFSTLRRLKTYLRSTMSSERESGLALMNINYHRDINIEEVINTFAQRQPRRLLFSQRKRQSLVRT